MTAPEMHDGPFHDGELAVQERAGVARLAAKSGGRSIRDHLTDQHQAFFPLLRLLFLGAADAQGAVWASVLPGAPGFVSAPDPRHLRVSVGPLEGDPLGEAPTPGDPVGILGLEFATRRRNRVSAEVVTRDTDGLTVAVRQAFGNCPKYIQTRDLTPRAVAAPGIERGNSLADADRALVSRADTLFIATRSSDASTPSDATLGADVSHRGGLPGFISLGADGSLAWPDFPGNLFYNTLGNLQADPGAGVTIIDWERGDVLMLSGRAEIEWGDPKPAATRFHPEHRVLLRDALPLRGTLLEVSPHLRQAD